MIPSERDDAVPPSIPAAAGADGPGVPDQRQFTHDGIQWVVRLAGEARAGNDWLAAGRVMLIRFAHAEAPDTPILEVIARPRDLLDLHESELVEMLLAARPIIEPRRVSPPPGGGLLDEEPPPDDGQGSFVEPSR